ncbi:leucine-rich repeats and immunoglobulin-like domains protein 2 isoform X1 [Chanodichthys erythropterus]|uniref:leucine-rich repeats and immunoglobulin-like domains protein 2 isoform X1 n=2 Tax=Chanodichthys erythropterus TaxID=933992 RepID=UPI00351F057A
MPGCYIHVWLFLFAVFAEEMIEVKVETGLYSRVELTGMSLPQDTVDSVEWTKLKRNGSQVCLIFVNSGTSSIKCYSDCCGKTHFYLNNNTLILENVTAQDEGVFKETVIRRNGTKKIQTFKLIIQYPPTATEIVLSWTSSTSVTLKCEVSGSFLHLMWKRERVPILEKHRYSFSERNQTLHIRNITSSDYGTYSCVVSNAYGESEQHIYITDENSTVNQGNGTSVQTQSGQKLLSSGLTLMGVVGLCIMFYGLYKYHHRQRAENGRTTDEGDADYTIVIYQEVSDFQQMTPLPYVYTDFIKPKEPNQASAGRQHFEDFGYSKVGSTCMAEPELQYCDEQSTVCPDTGEE